jgi:hypothetical protein
MNAMHDRSAERMEAMHDRLANHPDRVHKWFGDRVRPGQARFDPMLPDPAPDAATAMRGWETKTFNYPHGGVIAGPTYNLNYEDRPRYLQNDQVFALSQTGILVIDILLMPYYMVMEPPLYPVTYRGLHYPPSTTAAPPLPRG